MASAMKVVGGGCTSVCLLFLLAGPRALAVESAREGRQEGEVHDGQADFDFFIGSWRVHNRRLKKPLAGRAEWYEFEATVVARKVWDGRANIDEYHADTPAGPIEGLTLRLYDRKAGQWSLYWANAAKGRLDVPTVGSFKDGRGEFYDQEIFDGRSILVRYVWSDLKPNSCRWEQAFSADGGKTWETNWIMDFARTAPR